MEGKKSDWPHLLAVTENFVHVAVDTSWSVGVPCLLAKLLRWDQLEDRFAVGGEDLDALLAEHLQVSVVATGAPGLRYVEDIAKEQEARKYTYFTTEAI